MPEFITSPTQCAEAVVEELLTLCLASSGESNEIRRRKMTILIRQLIRDQYEHCAQTAEDWVCHNDTLEHLGGVEVGDAIAEAIRQLADDRVKRTVDKSIALNNVQP